MEDFGRYRILDPLGEGGQASVYRAEGPQGLVALKVWGSLSEDHARVRDRIRRESELVSRIDHPGVVKLVEAAPDAAVPYLAFEYIDGSSLDAWLRKRGPLRDEHARNFIVRTLDALVEVHAAPVAHLDLKPANIVFRTDADGLRPILLDFGIARSTELTQTRWTGQTTPFASPEQLRLETAYTPSDLFSWASLVYVAVTGRHPFGRVPALARERILDRDWLPERDAFDQALPGAPHLWELLVGCWHRDQVLRWPLLNETVTGRPTADTRALLGAVENSFGEVMGSRYRRGRIDPHHSGPSPWHELGAHLRHRRRHGLHPMSRRQLVAQRELLGRVGRTELLLMEMGWKLPTYDLVATIDEITGAQGYLRHLYACARRSDELGLIGRPRGMRYPIPGDASEQVEETPLIITVSPWQRTTFTFAIRNAGTAPWHDRSLLPVGPITGTESVPLRGEIFPVPDTPPGQIARVSVPIRAPGWPGIYRQRLKMVDAEREFCFPGRYTLGLELMIQVVRDEPG